MNRKLTGLLAAVAWGAMSQARLPPTFRRAPSTEKRPWCQSWQLDWSLCGRGWRLRDVQCGHEQRRRSGFVPFAFDNGRAGGRGWFGTVQIGADYQWGSWVAGIFADYDFSSIKGTIGELSGTGLVPFKQNSAWAGGGRIGYLVTHRSFRTLAVVIPMRGSSQARKPKAGHSRA